MPVSIKREPGARRDQLTILRNALNVVSVSFSAPKGVSSKIKRGILKPIYFIARGAVFVLKSAGPK